MSRWLIAFITVFAALAASFAEAQLPQKVLVISDIDDTLKESYVLNKIEVVKRALRTEPEIAYPGMAKAYRALDRDIRARGYEVRFAYVSAAPAQIMAKYHSEFLRRSRFPDGTLDLRPLWDAEDFKVMTIRSIIQFHRPAFVIMVGDHSEKDPRAYARIGEELLAARIPFVSFIRLVYGPDEKPAQIEAGQYAFVSAAEFSLGLYDAGLISGGSLREELASYATPGAAYVRCKGHRVRPGRSLVEIPDVVNFIAQKTAQVCR